MLRRHNISEIEGSIRKIVKVLKDRVKGLVFLVPLQGESMVFLAILMF